ncbi:MAG: hypothetical protein WKF76_04885 [Nocardioidaceae bacterium]
MCRQSRYSSSRASYFETAALAKGRLALTLFQDRLPSLEPLRHLGLAGGQLAAPDGGCEQERDDGGGRR